MRVAAGGVAQCAKVRPMLSFNETGDMFKPAEHFCRVAAISHEIVDEKQRQMIAAAR